MCLLNQVLYSPPTGPDAGRKLLQAAPAVDLTNVTTIASILTIAAQSVPTQSDEATRAALTQNLSGDQILAVSKAVANINSITKACTDAACIEKSQYYVETQVGNCIRVIPLFCPCMIVCRCDWQHNLWSMPAHMRTVNSSNLLAKVNWLHAVGIVLHSGFCVWLTISSTLGQHALPQSWRRCAKRLTQPLQLAPAVSELAAGEISVADFSAATTAAAITTGLASTALPGAVVPEKGKLFTSFAPSPLLPFKAERLPFLII